MDLRESWDAAAALGDAVPLHFYSVLFLRYPQLRALFPVAMAPQRDRLVGALGYIVANASDADQLTPMLRRLGADHRKYGVRPEDYGAVGEALVETLAHFLGEAWNAELHDAWLGAYQLVSSVMIGAAEADAQAAPSWWDAEIVDHQRRTPDIAVITLRPERHYLYEPGQSLSLTCDLRPNVWRFYSPANAPRPDNSIDLHVRIRYGGQLSAALVQSLRVGDQVRLGPASGEGLRLADGHLLMLAGGTGLAPLKALAEQAAGKDPTRPIDLFVGARTAADDYDRAALRQLAQECPSLRVTSVIGEAGSPDPVEMALRRGRWDDADIYICGSDEMVSDAVRKLRARGYARLHFEPPTAWFYGPQRYQKDTS